MKRGILLSALAASTLGATEVQLETLGVESTRITEVAQNAQTSADVAQALSNSVPSIDMSRRSGIANDILIRGQKRDNITVEVDGAKVYGACPNRMDPPASHIVANQIDSIDVIEGPYDVESFGTLSGGVKIKTKKPSKKPKGEINVGFGSFNYRKFGATASGGNDTIRLSLTASMEDSDQYKDGDGNTIAEQIDKYALTHPAAAGTKFQKKYHDMPAYSKRSMQAKAFITTAKNQELRLGVTANRSDDVLYGNSKMDALYDNSNIYNVEYNADKLSKHFTNLNFKYYHSDVDHPMATKYRMAATKSMMNNTNHLKTAMDGLKIKSTYENSGYKLLTGLDASLRNWTGRYYNTTTGATIASGATKSIDDTDTQNLALFTKLEKKMSDFKFSMGLRYDNSKITNATYDSRSYSALGANIMTNYALNSENSLFLGIGQASRVPDARELYFVNSKNKLVGTTDLNQVTNQEVDLGYKLDSDLMSLKIKGFYSMLSNYIYFNRSLATSSFENIDALIYGAELSSSIYIGDDMTLDIGAAYKVGEKKTLTTNQTDRDLTDIAPLRGSIALNYEYYRNSLATLEVKASDKWDKIDSDNGEQELAAWSILNFKIKHAINKKFDLTLGANNIFDATYALSNTGADLVLISTGSTSDVMLMNEPGRYIYANADFKF